MPKCVIRHADSNWLSCSSFKTLESLKSRLSRIIYPYFLIKRGLTPPHLYLCCIWEERVHRVCKRLILEKGDCYLGLCLLVFLDPFHASTCLSAMALPITCWKGHRATLVANSLTNHQVHCFYLPFLVKIFFLFCFAWDFHGDFYIFECFFP